MDSQTLVRPVAGISLTGKVALVTGSTSGIGLGIARARGCGRRGHRAQRPRQAR